MTTLDALAATLRKLTHGYASGVSVPVRVETLRMTADDLVAIAAAHDARAAELLAANNRELERRRDAETAIATIRAETEAYYARHDPATEVY